MHNRNRFDQFTERARKVLSLAQEEAQRFQHNYIGTEHLLLGLVREGEGVAAKVLISMGADLGKVRSAVEFIIGRGDRIILGQIGLTPRAKTVIEFAVDEAHSMNHHYIGTEHLLLGLLREGEGIGAGVLESLGIRMEEARKATLDILQASSSSQHRQTQQTPEIPYPVPESSYQHTRLAFTKDQPQDIASSTVLQDEDDITPAPSAGDTDPYDGFSVRARRVMETAEAEARAFQHSYIGVEHLLLGLLREEKGIAIFALGQLGIGYEEVRTSVASILGQGDSTADLEISLTPRLRNVITQAREEARLLNHHYIGTEHLLLGLVQEKQGPAAAILVEDMDVTLERVAIHVYLVLGQALSLRLTRLYP